MLMCFATTKVPFVVVRYCTENCCILYILCSDYLSKWNTYVCVALLMIVCLSSLPQR